MLHHIDLQYSEQRFTRLSVYPHFSAETRCCPDAASNPGTSRSCRSRRGARGLIESLRSHAARLNWRACVRHVSMMLGQAEGPGWIVGHPNRRSQRSSANQPCRSPAAKVGDCRARRARASRSPTGTSQVLSSPGSSDSASGPSEGSADRPSPWLQSNTPSRTRSIECRTSCWSRPIL